MALLGQHSWRAPFFGVSVLMAIALVATAFLLPDDPAGGTPTSLTDPFRALRHPALLLLALVAIFYNFGFFTLLAAGAVRAAVLGDHADRLDLLRLGPAAGLHLGRRRAAAAAPVRHAADPDRASLALFAAVTWP